MNLNEFLPLRSVNIVSAATTSYKASLLEFGACALQALEFKKFVFADDAIFKSPNEGPAATT